jgi:hypothetical protein
MLNDYCPPVSKYALFMVIKLLLKNKIHTYISNLLKEYTRDEYLHLSHL